MTFSIVARSADGRAYGVAVASKFLAVGAAVPAAEADTGALATQSYANLAYRPQGLALLRTGVAAGDVVAGLTAADPGRAQRQLGVVGPAGDGATYTGTGCHDWAGGLVGDGYAIQGNILTGEPVVVAMERAWQASNPAAPLGRRLLAALAAGDRAGGDRRGRQSAALLVVARGQGYGGTSDIVADLRVDDHADPVPELARLLDLHALYFDRPDPATLLELTGPLAEEVRAKLAALRHADDDLDVALASWAGVENLEERLVPGRIDPLVLAHLRGR
ncbi:MAG: fimbrial assembly protein FimA [Actinobacteria bacterium 13_2_20CM_2_71_6]|nr:MAG: fimbrial assembly protein FimA [Actinobacteria bacterium 13_2_20CM_2_71_6]